MDLNFSKKTQRLVLRPLNLTDYDTWKETYTNLKPAQNKWDLGPKKKSEMTKAQFKKILLTHKKNREKDSFYDLAAFDKKSGAMVGFSALMDITRNVFQNAYIGYVVFNNYWRNGFGKEMVSATLDIGFKDLKLHRIEAGIEPHNIRSIALAKSVKMRREGLSKRRLFLHNEWLDMAIYAMTAEEKGFKGHSGQRTQNRS